MPQPRISSHPLPLQTEQPLPPQTKHSTSISALGSVKGKYEGRRRVCTFAIKKPAHKTVEGAFHIAKSDILAHRDHFHLVELDLRAGADLFVAVTHARQNGAHRRRGVGAHGMDLPGGGMRAQHHPFAFHVEGIPHIAGGVIGGDVEQFKIVEVAFHIRGAIDLKAHLGKNGENTA